MYQRMARPPQGCTLSTAVLLGTVALSAMVVPKASYAQSVMDEIKVTAQRREQSLQDVSVSVTAFDGDTVDALGFTKPVDILSQVPNFTFIDPGISPSLTIRGNGLIDVGDANEAPVAVYFDDVYRSTLAGIGAQLFDVERIEVLRGPQGTLFGRNSTAGLVHFISRAPTYTFDASASLQYGSYDQVIAEGFVSGPLSDTVRARLSVHYNNDDGYQKNAAPTGGRFGATDVVSGRAQIEVDLSEDATILFTAWGTRQRNVMVGFPFLGRLDPNDTTQECPPADVWAGLCINGGSIGFGDPNLDHDTIYTERTPDELSDDLDLYGGSARLSWDLGDGIELTSITAYENVERTNVQDADSSYEGIGVFGGYQYTDINSIDARQFSQEVRLSGSQDNFNWVAGAFYFNDSKGPIVNIQLETIEALGLDFSDRSYIDTESWAVFGQVDVDVTDTVTLTAGIRYTEDDKKDMVESRDGSVGDVVTGVFDVSSNNTSGKLGLEYRPGEDMLWYASIATGFKSSEFTTTGLGGNVDGAAPVGDETVTAYEAGFKRTAFDGRLQFNAATFYNDIEDKQGRVLYSISENALINFGDMKSYGVEFEAKTQPVEPLELVLGVGLLDTEVDTTPDVRITRNYGREELALDGNEMQGAPHVTINGVVRYTLPFVDYGSATLQGDFRWQSSDYLDIANSPYDKQDSYGVVNLRAFWTSPEGRYTLTGFIENVFDEQYYARANSIAGFDYRFSVWGSKPRWFGVGVTVNYF